MTGYCTECGTTTAGTDEEHLREFHLFGPTRGKRVVDQPPKRGFMYLRNGDPGYPADPAEIELVSATPTQDGKYYAAGAENLEWLHDLARAWLETEDGVSEAMATVDSDIDEARERAAEYAAEARWDDR